MNRKYFRLVCVVAVLFALSFVLLPTAEARGLSGSRSAVTSTHDFWSSALAWFADLLPGGNVSRPVAPTHRSAASLGGPAGGGYTTNTGPCIDPNGANICSPHL